MDAECSRMPTPRRGSCLSGELPAATEANQSRLYYFRPLHDGDTISYEFLYEPGQVMVHPAIDRLAFLLEEGGVRIHWMTAGGN